MKKSKIRPMLSMLLALTMIMGSFGTFVSSAAEVKSGTGAGLTYTVSKDKVIITGAKTGLKKITIPSKIGGKAVTGIANDAFLNHKTISDVVISEGVKTIGNNAFTGSGLKTLKIPKSVTTIGREAFLMCENLTAITIPNGVKTVGGGAFNDNGLKELKLDKNQYLTYKNGVLFDKKQTKIISTLKHKLPQKYTIPSTVKSIDDCAFAGNSNLTTIKMPNSVTDIGVSAFHSNKKLTSITFSNKLKVIGDYAFCLNTSLKTVKLPNSLTSVGVYAFDSCTQLTSITIPAAVKTIGEGSFGYCNKLTEIKVSQNNKSYSAKSGVLFDKKQTTLIAFPAGKKVSKYAIPSTVKTVAGGAFGGNQNLTTIEIPKNVSKIGDFAFANSKKLAKITVPKTVKSIGFDIFDGCDNLPVDINM